MYYVVNKTTRELLWCNPAPLHQNLSPGEIWGDYDADVHDAIKSDPTLTNAVGDVLACPPDDQQSDVLPDYYDLSEDALALATIWNKKRLADGGFIAVPAGKKYLGDVLTDKTRAEKLADGEITVEDVQTEKKGQVLHYYNSLIKRGCLYDGVVYSCSKQARDWLLGQKTVDKDTGWTLPWGSKDKMTEIVLNESNLGQFLKHLADHFRTVSQISQEKIKLISRSVTIAELDAVDWTANWTLPATLPPE